MTDVDADAPTGDAATASTGFYDRAVGAAEMAEARKVSGIDEEVAALRVRLAKLTEEQPGNLALALKCSDALVRAVRMQYRMSEKRTDEFGRAMQAVTESLGEALTIGEP